MGKWQTPLSWKLWQHSLRAHAKTFSRALNHPEIFQARQLRLILLHANGSHWARQFDIESRTPMEDFRRNVPVQEPHNLQPWTDRIAKGEKSVLFNKPVERLVPTSGTTGKNKLIPMTAGSRLEFSTGVGLWLYDCMRNCPEIMKGRAYIATSPAIHFSSEQSAVPVEFASDSQYLGRLERLTLSHILAVPLSIANLRGSDWREASRRHLLAANNLRFLSLWHPNYLESLFDKEELSSLPDLWPHLACISTWADGACAQPAGKMMRQFPGAIHYPKGLWLTEGIVSIPWESAFPISLLSGFYEFETPTGDLLLAHQLTDQETYRPVLTNHAGLYRYRLGDIVQVNGFIGRTPSIRWIGRCDQVSDLCGEKLSESQVAQALQDLEWKGFFAMISVARESQSYYLCLTWSDEKTSFPLEKLDQKLRQNIHYDWARQIKQLEALHEWKISSEEIGKIQSEITWRQGQHRKASFLILPEDSKKVHHLLEASRCNKTQRQMENKIPISR